MKTLLAMLALVVTMTGCQSVKPTAFRPLEAKLEPVSGGVADYFVLVNASGHELRNYHLSAYLWTDRDRNALRQNQPFRHCFASGASWAAGGVLHFRVWEQFVQAPVIVPLSKIEVVGHCDEGSFCQFWKATESGQLVAAGTSR